MADAETEEEPPSAERLTLFSDAVVAIAITLLAIDLPVPDASSSSAFWTSARHDSGHYAAFLISFFVIAGAWAHHHDMFRYIKRIDGRLRAWNTWWLLTNVLNPFATKMLTGHGQTSTTRALEFGFYSLLQVVDSAALLIMGWHAVRAGLAADSSHARLRQMMWSSGGTALAFALSIPVFFVTRYGWVVWFASPFLIGRVRQYFGRSKTA